MCQAGRLALKYIGSLVRQVMIKLAFEGGGKNPKPWSQLKYHLHRSEDNVKLMSVLHRFFQQCDEYDTDCVVGPVAAGMKILVIITGYFLLLLILLLTCYY